MVGEIIKKDQFEENLAAHYFWRNHQQQEIDLIEERDGKLFGYEFKWGKKTIKPPRRWSEDYPGSGFEVITPENYLNFIV